jgi:hypothetical protein
VFTPVDCHAIYEEVVDTIEVDNGDDAIADEESTKVTPIKREIVDTPLLDELQINNEWEDNPDDSAILDERSFHLTSAYHDDSLISANSPRIIQGPEDLGQPHFSTSHLRSLGKDDDYIALLHRIVLRGYEPLLPAYMRFEFHFLPDELFAASNDEAFLSTSPASEFRASKEFDHLMELSSRVRDRVSMGEHFDIPPAPEDAVRRHLSRYYEFLLDDAKLDAQTRIPVLAMVFGSVRDSAAMLREEASRQCARLAGRWRLALEEATAEGEDTPQIPTLYAIVASHTIIAIMSYSPRQTPYPSQIGSQDSTDDDDDVEPQCAGMAILDLSDANNAVWDALALACVGCHVRNVMVRLAEHTGIGMMTRKDMGRKVSSGGGAIEAADWDDA